jgi:hypothetical protein
VITPLVLLQRIERVRSALTERSGDPGAAADAGQRVAASVTQLGLVARVVAPALAAQALGRPLDLRLGGLWWQDTLGGPLPLSVPAPAAGSPASPADPTGPSSPPGPSSPTGPSSPAGPPGPARPADEPIGAPAEALMGEVIAPLTAAVATLAPVSKRVLWGNVASAVNGAASQVARGRPELAAAAWVAAAAFFRRPELATEPGPPGPSFRRASCCLIYRLAPARTGAICGDCVLGGC